MSVCKTRAPEALGPEGAVFPGEGAEAQTAAVPESRGLGPGPPSI